MALTPEQEARYALHFGVSRSDLSYEGQAEYDRLKGTAVIVSEEDETPEARVNRIEANIKRSLGWSNAVLLIFLIIAIPDPATGETNQNPPVWMWWGIGIAVVMLLLTQLVFKNDVPRRIAERLANETRLNTGDGGNAP